jgi:hypothetical protein
MKTREQRDLFPGALEVVILRTLRRQPLGGYAPAQHIQRTSKDLLPIEVGSPYPALGCLLKEKLVKAEAPRAALCPLLRSSIPGAAPLDGQFGRTGALVLGSIENAERLSVHGWMSRYGDRTMDFADAALVHLAKRASLSAILTVDHADCATYRIEGKRPFRRFPVHQPWLNPFSCVPVTHRLAPVGSFDRLRHAHRFNDDSHPARPAQSYDSKRSHAGPCPSVDFL